MSGFLLHTTLVFVFVCAGSADGTKQPLCSALVNFVSTPPPFFRKVRLHMRIAQTQQASHAHIHTLLAAMRPALVEKIEMAWVCGGVNLWRCVGGSFVLQAFPAISPHLCRFRHDAVDAA